MDERESTFLEELESEEEPIGFVDIAASPAIPKVADKGIGTKDIK